MGCSRWEGCGEGGEEGSGVEDGLDDWVGGVMRDECTRLCGLAAFWLVAKVRVGFLMSLGGCSLARGICMRPNWLNRQ